MLPTYNEYILLLSLGLTVDDKKILDSFLDWLNAEIKKDNPDKEILTVDALYLFNSNETVSDNISQLFKVWLDENVPNGENKNA